LGRKGFDSATPYKHKGVISPKHQDWHFKLIAKIRTLINRTLQKLVGDNFVKFKDISFPGDFDKDLVHWGTLHLSEWRTTFFVLGGFYYWHWKDINCNINLSIW
jgi:hypothetical protein